MNCLVHGGWPEMFANPMGSCNLLRRDTCGLVALSSCTHERVFPCSWEATARPQYLQASSHQPFPQAGCNPLSSEWQNLLRLKWLPCLLTHPFSSLTGILLKCLFNRTWMGPRILHSRLQGFQGCPCSCRSEVLTHTQSRMHTVSTYCTRRAKIFKEQWKHTPQYEKTQ